MFKKSLLILILFFSFNLSVSAACDGVWNTLVPFTDSPQECRTNTNTDDLGSIDSLTEDYNNVKNLTIPEYNVDTGEYEDRPATAAEKAAEITRIGNEMNDLGNNINDRQTELGSNNAVIAENEQNLNIFTNDEDNWDALNKEVEVNRSIEKIVDLQDKIDALEKQDEELGISHNADKIKELEGQRDAIIVPTYTEEEQKIVDEKNRLEEQQKADLEAIENGEVLMTEAQKEEARQKSIEADNKVVGQSKTEDIEANPGLELINKGDPSVMYALLHQTKDSNIVKINEGGNGGLTTVGGIFVWIKDALVSLIVLVSVGAFLFVGVRLGLARGNPEEFKKSMIQFVYAIVGIFIISIAYAVVTLIAGLNL